MSLATCVAPVARRLPAVPGSSSFAPAAGYDTSSLAIQSWQHSHSQPSTLVASPHSQNSQLSYSMSSATGYAHWETDDQRLSYPSSSSCYPSLALSSASPYSTPDAPPALSYAADFSATQRSGLHDHTAPNRSFPAHAGSGTVPPSPPLDRSTWGDDLYVLEPASPAQSPRVKEEDEEGGFIFEVPNTAASNGPAFAAMPEVPLRATQACGAMRAMMTAFRLDPFAMHNGIRGAASAPVCTMEIGPLREPPVIFEWQVHLDEPLVPQTPQWEPRSLSESPLYGLEEQEDEKWAQAEEYAPYAHSTAAMPTQQQQQQASVEFEPLMTPAQSLNWSMRYQTSETHGSAYSPLPQAQVSAPRTTQTSLAFASRMEQRLPTGYNTLTHDRSDEVYRNTRPARMHLPPQHTYSTYANSNNLVNASSNTGGWYRKSIPASYGAEDYYALQQDADSATTTPTPPPFAAPVARRHVWATTYAPDVRALCVA